MHYVYNAATGVFTGQAIKIEPFDAQKLAQVVPEGHATFEIDVEIDVLSKKIDLATGALIDYQPAQPANTFWFTHAWSETTRRWEQVPTDAAKAVLVREQRNQMLAQCDWTQMTDSPLTPEQKSAWSAYRTALRGITEQSGFPNSINWPTEPA